MTKSPPQSLMLLFFVLKFSILCDKNGILKIFTFEKIINLSVKKEIFTTQKEKLTQIKEKSLIFI